MNPIMKLSELATRATISTPGISEVWKEVCKVVVIVSPILFLCLLVLAIFRMIDLKKQYSSIYDDPKKTKRIWNLLVLWGIIAGLSAIAMIALPVGLAVGLNLWN